MSKIKSFSVNDGDMFYIKHNSDNFTIIDCHLLDDNKERIIKDIKHAHLRKGITRFISTHPDEDHIKGLKHLDDNIDILNFYCVKNEVTKEDDSDDFKHYCELRDSERKAFYIYEGCTRRWMNQKDEERGSSGINILWPDEDNEDFQEALEAAEDGGSPNNISAIIKYSQNDGVTALWMGDLETEFMEKVEEEVDWPEVDILFAPHHGRESGKIPESILKQLNPKVVVIGEAPSENIDYYSGYDTICQNSAGDITIECNGSEIDFFVSSSEYSVNFLDDEDKTGDDYYLGTLNI